MSPLVETTTFPRPVKIIRLNYNFPSIHFTPAYTMSNLHKLLYCYKLSAHSTERLLIQKTAIHHFVPKEIFVLLYPSNPIWIPATGYFLSSIHVTSREFRFLYTKMIQNLTFLQSFLFKISNSTLNEKKKKTSRCFWYDSKIQIT